jgi:hypothetical protein
MRKPIFTVHFINYIDWRLEKWFFHCYRNNDCQERISLPNAEITFFYICGSVHHQSILLNNQRDEAWSSRIYSSLQGYSTCFGCFLHPSSGVMANFVGHDQLCWPWHCEIDSRPWTSFNRFKPHRHMNCTYDCICSFNYTPDDGCRKHPKHVE